MPVLKTRKRLAGMKAGDWLIVETSDPLAPIDLAAFCSEFGHTLVSTDPTGDGHRFTIIKG